MGIFSRKKNSEEAEAAEGDFILAKSQMAGGHRTVLFDDRLGVYHRWYFEFRLKEEFARATRYGWPMSLLVLLIERNTGLSEPELDHLFLQGASAISHAIRATDLVSVLDPGVFVICMTMCDGPGAEAASMRIHALLDTPHSIGRSLFPDDHLGPDELLAFTRHRASQATQFKGVYTWKP